MGDVPRWTMIPAPRCCSIESFAPLSVCNRRARWMSEVRALELTEFWCDDHKQDGATPIAGVSIVRRLSIVAQIVMTSSVRRDVDARIEALNRLELGIRDAGGVLNLHAVTQATGPWAAPERLGDGNGTKAGS